MKARRTKKFGTKGRPGRTCFVKGVTDNRNRTVAEIRKFLAKNAGVLGGAGTAGWAFDRKGTIQLAKSAASEDKLMDVAVGAGADDYTAEGDEWSIVTPAESLNIVLEALEKGSIA